MTTRQMSRRRFLGLTAGLAGGAVLAACVPATGPAPGAQGGEGTAPATETRELSFDFTWDAAFQPRQTEFNDRFMENHPDIEITTTYNTWADHNRIVPTWAAAGTLPDVIYVHGRYAFPWNFEGILIPLDSWLESDAEFNVEGIWNEALRLYQYNGQQYEIPYDHGPVLLGYNKTLFDEVGLDYPSEDWTMDDFREAAIALSDPDNQQWGYSGNFPNMGNESSVSSLQPWGGSLINDAETQLLLDSAEAREAINFWLDLILEHQAAPTPAQSEAFEQGPWISGRVGMDDVPSWETPGLTQFATFEWDVAPWPAGPAQQVTGSFGSGFGITRDADNPDDGWTYLREYLSEDGMEFMWGSTGRGSPARQAAYDSWMASENAPEHAEYYLDALENYAVTGRPYQTLAGAEVLDILNRETTLMKSGEKPAEDAIQAMIEEGNRALQEAAERLQ